MFIVVAIIPADANALHCADTSECEVSGVPISPRLCRASGGRWCGSGRRTTPCAVIGSVAWAAHSGLLPTPFRAIRGPMQNQPPGWLK
jgi:hypothetical protein